MYTIADIEKLIATVEDSMGDCDFMVYPSPVRALDVGALLTVARENMALQAKIADALAIEAQDGEYGYEHGWNDARDAYRAKLTGGESE